MQVTFTEKDKMSGFNTCPTTPTTEEVKMERLTDVINADVQLAGCQTVAELCERKPDVGSVLLRGNNLGPEHGLNHETCDLQCTSGASYVAKCCFVGSNATLKSEQSEHLIFLPHSATIADLKGELFDHHRAPVVAVLDSTHIPATTKQEYVKTIVCKDPDGNLLEDSHLLPEASPTACADVGCHATFFLDIKPQSMDPDYVKTRIKASPSAIADFVCASHSLGADAYKTVGTSKTLRASQNFESFGRVRGELTSRLTDFTRAVPAKMSASELKVLVSVFSEIAHIEGCQSDLPASVRDYAEELIKNIETTVVENSKLGEEACWTSKLDALDPNFPKRILEHLDALEMPVRELVLLQMDEKWINYETKTEHQIKMTVNEITSKVMECEESLRTHEDNKLHVYNRSRAEMDETTEECGDFAGHSEALYKIFLRALTTHSELARMSFEYAATFEHSQGQAKDADAIFQTELRDETINVERLSDLKTEHTGLHVMVCEQVKMCKAFVVLSHSDSEKKELGLEREIKRLQALKQQEITRRSHLNKCKKYLDTVQMAENADTEAFDTKWATAHSNAKERWKRSTVGVQQSVQFVERLRTLHKKIQLEFEV